MAGSLKTLNIYQNGSSIYNASTFTSYGIWTDGNKIYKTNNHTPQSGDTELVTLTTTISGLYHNADGEQVSVGLNTVLVITTLAATDIIVYCVNAGIKTTLDLSTLSGIADGAHTVKVKAKANGYIDSEFSNEVSYTKAPAPKYNVTVIGHKAFVGASPTVVAIKADSDSVSYSDYTVYVEGRYSYEHTAQPNIVGQSTFTASKVAMIGDVGDTYKINNGATVNFTNGATPVIIELTEDTTIDIGVEFEE